MRKGPIYAMLLTPALAVVTPCAAQVGDVKYCNQYAQAAVDQVRAARSKPNCAAQMTGARWSASIRVHFNYCMSNPIYDVQNVQSARETYLRSCGAI